MKRFSLFILTLLLVYPAVAEMRYISDELWINLRSGPGSEFRIIKLLKSGSHLTFIEDDLEKSFTKVTTDKGLEGWVPTRFLVNEPIAFEKLILTQRELKQTKTDLSELKIKHSEAKKQLASSKRQGNKLNKDNSSQVKELAHIKKISANAIGLNKKNQELMAKSEQFKITVDTLKAENNRLKNSRDLDYILLGGFLILLGLFLGWLLPKISGKRGEGWA